MTQLVIYAPNWLGDAVMALPAIADVRRAFPGVRVAIAARAAVAPLFALVPDVDVLTVDRGGRFDSSEAAGSRRFDAALLLPNSFKSALAAWRAGIPERWGYRTDCRGPLLTRSVPTVRGRHQAEYYQHLTASLGFAAGPLQPRIDVPADLRARASALLSAAGWNGQTPLASLAPGAAYGGAKKWPAAAFGELASGLSADGVTCVLVGSAADAAAGRDVADAVVNQRRPIDLIGQTDLPLLAGVLASCRALVSNDSGAMHFGAAVGVPVTAMFGPTNEQATRPLGPAHSVLTHEVWCRPCMLRECPLDHRCMRGIAVEDVLAAARRSL
jgi:heptosyltransferase-2